MIRVISGKYRHRLLNWPKSKDTRPTMDKVREAIFSSLRMQLEGKIVLDLFAGSGSMAIEAVSNYAMKAVAVEKDKEAVKIIYENVNALQINNIEVFNTNALAFLKSKTGRVFDYIFLDPPYAEYDLLNECLKLVKQNNFLSKNGLIVVETNDGEKITLPEGLMVQKNKKYGKVHILYISHIN